jgi:hypothetical protein
MVELTMTWAISGVGAGLREARELGKRLGRRDWGRSPGTWRAAGPYGNLQQQQQKDEQHDSKRAASATSAVLALQ